jgi:hypothetical protein
MSTNGQTSPVVKASSRSPRQDLSRGLRDILSEQSLFDSQFNQLQEHVKAARIGAAILELIDIVEAKYQPVIFKSVAAYRAVSQEESTEEIARKLTELERKRTQREQDHQKPKRRWYYLYLR